MDIRSCHSELTDRIAAKIETTVRSEMQLNATGLDMGMSQMLALNDTAWGRTTDDAGNPKLDTHTTGLVAGTQVATNSGWADVETIRTGQKVLTFDNGLQTVISVSRQTLTVNAQDTASLPLHVPAGTLGNRTDMMILPHQPAMIESDIAETITGDPFALIPGASFIGFRGIVEIRSFGQIEVIQLHFAQDEVVYASIGALFLCRTHEDLKSDATTSAYHVLSADVAEDLIDCMTDQDNAIVTTATQIAPVG